MALNLYKENVLKQSLLSMALVVVLAAACYPFAGMIGYRVVAFILLLYVSTAAVVLHFIPVLLAAVLSALAWNFFFIPPKFTFHVGSAEDGLLFLMYFIIASINAVLTNRIRKAEKEVRDREERAKHLKLYGTLFNSLSHELKTPIATIVAAADNMLSPAGQPLQPINQELAENISVAALRLNRQVENLLSMSRLESGFILPKQDWCDINELVYAIINRLEQQLKNYTVQVAVEDKLPLYKLDGGLLEQALYNLLYNASIYTPEFTTIQVTAKNGNHKTYGFNTSDDGHNPVKREEQALVIIIEDQGPGFPPAEIEKVFDKFYRLENTATGGTGLGLSIAKGLVEAQNGTILLENVPHGARFTIQLPAEASFLNNLKNE